MRLDAADIDTIAAIATPPGEGGIAVLRLSGPQALEVARRVFRPAGRGQPAVDRSVSHVVHYGHIVRDDQRLDEVLLTVLRAPRTFTREDVVEISCHGGVFVARQVLATVLAAGARLAQPGEFTRRAFLNGRLDLTQAEAITDLIHARTELALAAANEQLGGALSRRIQVIRSELLTLLAHVEAHLDFPDEDIAPDTREQLLTRLEASRAQMEALLATAREGQVLRRGIRVAIIGRPNAGKSSLLNELLGRDRAIVSPIPGTTRDTIEETANIRGIPVVFVDTAGLREATDQIEEEGIRRSRHAAGQAELLLHVLDRSQPLTPTDRLYLEEFSRATRLVVLNKADLPSLLEVPAAVRAETVPVSCRTGAGVEDLKEAIARRVWSAHTRPSRPEAAINARHEDALRRSVEAALRAREALTTDLPLELAAQDLRISLHAVGEIIGQTTTEDLLDSIFSQFCIGK